MVRYDPAKDYKDYAVIPQREHESEMECRCIICGLWGALIAIIIAGMLCWFLSYR